ncbi:MAG TPA: PH domain-containing protein [Acidothermaceae bacterium]|nr:PH domain-containing protein [Acidothermaceae bacterium]
MSQEIGAVFREGRPHPATAIVKAGRFVVSLLGLAAVNYRDTEHAGWLFPVIGFGLAIVFVAGAYLSWLFTNYRIADGDVRVDTGVFVKRSRRVRIDRLQAVDVVQPLFARMLGLAELKLDMAGGHEGKVALAYLRLEDARALRASLLAMAAGLDHRTPEAPERPLVSCSAGAIVGGALLSTPAIIGFLWIVLFITVAVVTGTPGIIGGTLPGVLGAFATVWQTIQQHSGFTVADSPDGLRLRHGLLETRSQTVPPGRVQAVRIVQPFLWRLCRWVRVEANVAGYAGRSANEGHHHNSVLLPVGTPEQARAVMSRVLPGVDIDAIEVHRVPSRAKWRSPVRWWTFRAGSNDQVFAVRSGVLETTYAVMRHEKIQSVALSVGPLQRLLRLATVHLHSTHGPVDVVAPDRDIAEARRIVDVEAALARQGRAVSGPERWMGAPPPVS